ncbi:MAG: antibiotic biosynthesis monooxygenase [Coxiellaceae bacterium]|nr:MAG: antibiotic biosynthesis monooxygenase [Coxiellaceae bacterium]
MQHKKYTVLAILEAKPGKEQALKTLLMSLVRPSSEEPGCVNYDLHSCLDNPAKFMFYENWVDRAAHEQHRQTPHMQAWRAQRDELLAKPSEVTFGK